MARASFWINTVDHMLSGTTSHVGQIERAAQGFVADLARKAEHKAKSEHPFNNRTGRAEAGFQGLVRTDGRGKYAAVLRQNHADRAGLEYWHAGKWATIAPVMRSLTPEYRAFCRRTGFAS